LRSNNFADVCTTSASAQNSSETIAVQIRRLEVEEARIMGVIRELKKDLNEHWTVHAAFGCRGLVARVQQLPRELRIMVFEALWGDAYHIITDWNLEALKTQPADPLALVESWSERNLVHCLDERFVGAEMLREIVEAWWYMSVFEFKHCGLLPKLFVETFWGEKVGGRINKVVVLFRYCDQGRRFGSPRITTGANHVSLEDELECLFGLEKTTQVTFKIKRREMVKRNLSVGLRRAIFMAKVNDLFPTFNRLKKEGYNVMLVIDGDIRIASAEMDITFETCHREIDKAVQVSYTLYKAMRANMADDTGVRRRSSS
jgi:hypothetical protein